MELEWNDFDGNGLTGMEAFVNDDFSIHIVRYEHGEGFHWLARAWDENGQCSVTGSYDFTDTQDGWELLSDAYRGALAYMNSIGVITEGQRIAAEQPSAIRRLLSRAAALGFAAMISLSAIVGAASGPVLAYADESSPSAGDVFVEMRDGKFSIASTDGFQSGDTVSYLHDGGTLSTIEPGSDFYNMIVDAMGNGYQGESDRRVGAVGPVEGWLTGEKDIKFVIEESTYDIEFGLLAVTHDALKNVYEQYCDDGEMHPVEVHYFTEGSLVDAGRAWVDEMLASEGSPTTQDVQDYWCALLVISGVGVIAIGCLSGFFPIAGGGTMLLICGLVNFM